MFMYKFNLQNINESNWIGSRLAKKKNIKSMQKLRDLKFKSYPFWRIDKINFQVIKGGWHFSFLQTPEQILNKIKSFSHGEFNNESINEKEIEKKILENKDIFNRGFKLKKIDLDDSYPKYIIENKEKFFKMDSVILVRRIGVEPITSGAEIRRSIQLKLPAHILIVKIIL